jgi:hypothetical protein
VKVELQSFSHQADIAVDPMVANSGPGGWLCERVPTIRECESNPFEHRLHDRSAISSVA